LVSNRYVVGRLSSPARPETSRRARPSDYLFDWNQKL